MPSKKKKYNARFPAGRIKKIMQTDEEVGKVAQAVPVIISRTLELFVESLLTKSMQITLSRNAKTLTPSHMKQCILSESRFDFLKDLVKNIPDASVQEDNENNAIEVIDYSIARVEEPKEEKLEVANFYTEQSTSTGRTPVIQFSPKVPKLHNQIKIEAPTEDNPKTVATLIPPEVPKLICKDEVYDQIKIEVPCLVPPEVPKLSLLDDTVSPNIHIDLSAVAGNFSQPATNVPDQVNPVNNTTKPTVAATPSAAISSNYGQNTSDNLYIDEDYDN